MRIKNYSEADFNSSDSECESNNTIDTESNNTSNTNKTESNSESD